MMKRESRGEVNDLCAKLGRVEQALQCHKAEGWTVRRALEHLLSEHRRVG